MQPPMTISISNPSNLPLIDYRTVKPLQGGLKDLSDQNYAKLKNVLIKRGFRVPLFLWHFPQSFEGIESAYYLMDGHQRQRVMIKEDMQPYEVPYILIEAESLSAAKAQLLEISSQYGRIQQDELDTFTAELPDADLADLSFDALPDFSRENGTKIDVRFEAEKHELVCPECGHVNSASAFKPVKAGELSNI